MAINEYLKLLNFSERVYYEYSGNDTVCVVLSDAMKKILQNNGIITHSDYLPLSARIEE